MDWNVVFSVIIGIFLFNFIFQGLKFILVVLVGLTTRRQLKSPEHNHNEAVDRGSFG